MGWTCCAGRGRNKSCRILMGKLEACTLEDRLRDGEITTVRISYLESSSISSIWPKDEPVQFNLHPQKLFYRAAFVIAHLRPSIEVHDISHPTKRNVSYSIRATRSHLSLIRHWTIIKGNLSFKYCVQRIKDYILQLSSPQCVLFYNPLNNQRSL